MSELVFSQVWQAPLVGVTARFEAGMHWVVGTERDGTKTLIALAAGMLKPRRGAVTLDGEAPFASGQARRDIGSALALETLPPGASVLGAIRLALAASDDPRDARALLADAGLERLAAREPERLGALDRRAVALMLALSRATPKLIAIHDPRTLTHLISADFLREQMARALERGATLLMTTPNTEDAMRWGGSLSILESGRLLAGPHARAPLSVGRLRVRTQEQLKLSEALAAYPDLSGIEARGRHDLVIYALELEAAAQAVIAAARAKGILIQSLRCELLPRAPAGQT